MSVVLYSTTSLLFLAANTLSLYHAIENWDTIRIVPMSLNSITISIQAFLAYNSWKQFKQATSQLCQLEYLKSQIGNQEISQEKETSLLNVFSNLNLMKDNSLYQASAIFDQLDAINVDCLSPAIIDMVDRFVDSYLSTKLKLKTVERNQIIQKILKKVLLADPFKQRLQEFVVEQVLLLNSTSPERISYVSGNLSQAFYDYSIHAYEEQEASKVYTFSKPKEAK